MLPGPFASLLLSDLGARVDKLEDPRAGDYMRSMFGSAPDGMSAVFHQLNRGKRSLVLDLKTEAGCNALQKLIVGYDVLLESFRPGVMDRLGLGYQNLSSVHPKLVYCAISGFGQDGPKRDVAGHDLNYLAHGGALGLSGPPDAPPQVPSTQQADIGGGLYAALSVLAAIISRDKHGRGSFIDIAMNEVAMSFATFGLTNRLAGVALPRGRDPLAGGVAVYGVYETSDGGLMSLAALEPKFWNAFCAALGIVADMNALMPGPHQRAIKAQLEEIFKGRTRAQWQTFAAETDCCLEPVLNPDELLQDAHHQARSVFAKLAGITQFRTPVGKLRREPAPKKGAHTEEILTEAGFAPETIAGLMP